MTTSTARTITPDTKGYVKYLCLSCYDPIQKKRFTEHYRETTHLQAHREFKKAAKAAGIDAWYWGVQKSLRGDVWALAKFFPA